MGQKDPMRIMNLLKSSLVFCLFSFIIHSFVFGQLSVPVDQAASPILSSLVGKTNVPIVWEGSEWSPRAAALVPVSIPGLEEEFYFQFDLGSARNLLYESTLQQLDSMLALQSVNTPSEKGLSLVIGDWTLEPGDYEVYPKEARIHFDDPEARNIIGTLGSDIIPGHYTIIDFLNSQLTIQEASPSLPEEQYGSMVFQHGAVLLPAKLGDESLLLYFDTGSSAFELITDEPTWDKLKAPGAKPRSFQNNSWGRTLISHVVESQATLRFAKADLPLREVAYVEGASEAQVSMMLASGMQGMLGNQIFSEKVVVLDGVQNRYAILDHSPFE